MGKQLCDGQFCMPVTGWRILMLSWLLLATYVNRTEQFDGALQSTGCISSPSVHQYPYDDVSSAASNVNLKTLKCYNVSISIINRDYFRIDDNDGAVAYKEIILERLRPSDETLNVINEQQTELFKLIDSEISDGQLQKIFHQKNFSRLKVLDLRGNRLQTVKREMFRHCTRLRVVNLSHNEIRLVMGDSFHDLRELRELYLNENRIIDFSQSVDVFTNLRQLLILDLSMNSINDIPRHIFNGLENLVHLNLTQNKLYLLPFQTFEDMQSIEVMDLSHNLLVSFLDNFFMHNRKLKILQLHHNSIKKINKNSLYGLKELHTLDLSGNDLLTVDRNAFDTLDDLQYLNLAHNRIQMLSATIFLSLTQLQSIDLSYNEMKQLPLGIFAHQFKLREILMDFTHLETIRNWISTTNTNTTINKSILKNLEHVSLRNSTNLRSVESCMFLNMPNVKKLSITNSQLIFLPKGIGEMKKLVELDLSNNRLEFIPEGIKELTSLSALNLLGNDLQCDCHMFWMLNWIDELKVKNKTLPHDLLRLSELKCRNGYPGDIIKVLQHINCVKPFLIFSTNAKKYEIFTDAILECSFAGTPAPEIIWRTPHGEILRHNEFNDIDATAKFQLEQHHRSILKDTQENKKFQDIIENERQSDNLSIRQGPGITLLENGFLKVHNISRLNGGLYSCFAINIMGNATTDVR